MVASSPIQYHEELSSGAMGAGGTDPCSPNQQQPLSSVQSPTTHAAACNQQQQQPSPAIDIHAYQPPWKGLVDYAQQSQAAQQAPGSTNKASPNHHHQQQQPDRLDASSPRYVQLIGQIHGYGNNQIEQLTAPDNSHQVIELHPPQAPPAPQPPQSSASSGSSNNNNNNGNSIANQLTARPQYSPGAIVQQQQQQSGPLMSPQLYPHQHPHPAHTAASLMHPPPPQHLHHAHHHLTVQQQQQQVSGPPPPPLGHHMHQFQQQH